MKRAAYLKLEIPEYWIVNAEARSVSVFRPEIAETTIATESLQWQARTDVSPLAIDLVALLGG